MLVTYDPLMIAASVVVAVMASFTGLRLTSGLRFLEPQARKAQIAKAAFALGGGIWSMHFVGMLAVKLPVPVTYGVLYTLGSVLISILIVGVGLSLMHMGERTLARTVSAGTLTGLGIVSMHYVGMEAIGGNCRVAYAPTGFFISTSIAILFSTCALKVAYRKRTLVQTSLAAVVLGVTISGMHYSAMAYTRFMPLEDAIEIAEPVIRADYLALVVAVAAFVICGLFLLTALPIAERWPRDEAPAPSPVLAKPAAEAASVPESESHRAPTAAPDEVAARVEVGATPGAAADTGKEATPLRLPYEQHQVTYFIDADRIHAIQAEGHYTRLYDGRTSYFCPLSISEVETRLVNHPFLRTHRSYMVNLRHAKAFRRRKDKGYVIVPGMEDSLIPVSRSRLAEVRAALGLAAESPGGATTASPN